MPTTASSVVRLKVDGDAVKGAFTVEDGDNGGAGTYEFSGTIRGDKLTVVFADNWLPDVAPLPTEHGAVDVGREVPLHAQIARGEAGGGDQDHQRPIEQKERCRDDGLRTPPRVQEDEGGDEIADADALEHAGDANRGKVVAGEAGEDEAKGEDDGGSAEDFQVEVTVGTAHLSATAKGKHDRDADDEEEEGEEGEDKIGRCPPVPLGVRERRVVSRSTSRGC